MVKSKSWGFIRNLGFKPKVYLEAWSWEWSHQPRNGELKQIPRGLGGYFQSVSRLRNLGEGSDGLECGWGKTSIWMAGAPRWEGVGVLPLPESLSIPYLQAGFDCPPGWLSPAPQDLREGRFFQLPSAPHR